MELVLLADAHALYLGRMSLPSGVAHRLRGSKFVRAVGCVRIHANAADALLLLLDVHVQGVQGGRLQVARGVMRGKAAP